MKTTLIKESHYGRIEAETSGSKPTYFAALSSNHPSVLALAESLFWTDIGAEHAGFIARLLPIEELPAWHVQALAFHDGLARVHRQCLELELEPGEIKNVIRLLVLPWHKQLLKFKQELQHQQKAAAIRTSIWPSFLAHFIHEEGRFIHRLRLYQNDRIEFKRREIIGFWTPIMSEHLINMGHQLDPDEEESFDKFMTESQAIDDSRQAFETGQLASLEPAITRVIDFKTAMTAPIEQFEIASMMAPGLVDHARREALLFKLELQRAEALLELEA